MMTQVTRSFEGSLPTICDQDIIFFANILSIFYGNKQETDILRKEVGALETYGGRVIPILNLISSGKNNVIILEKEPNKDLLSYFYKDLNLTLPQLEVIDHRLYELLNEDESYSLELNEFVEQIKSFSAGCLHGYVTDSALEKLAGLAQKETLCSSKSSREGNNKFSLFEYLKGIDLPIFDTCVAQTSGELGDCYETLKSLGYKKAVIKAPIGASGIGMLKVSLNDALKELPDYLFYEGPCMVQGWLDDSIKGVEYIGSPSLQMMINQNGCVLYDITEQILSVDSIHEGNVSPPYYMEDGFKEDVLQQSEVAARWLHDQGYRGTASIDFLYTKRDSVPELRICEINARVTGATYPSVLARHFFPKGAWLMRNLSFSKALEADAILQMLEGSNLLYRPGMPAGVLPFNFNPDEKTFIGKGQFLFLAPTMLETTGLLKRMTNMDNLQGSFDRD